MGDHRTVNADDGAGLALEQSLKPCGEVRRIEKIVIDAIVDGVVPDRLQEEAVELGHGAAISRMHSGDNARPPGPFQSRPADRSV